MLDSQFEIQLHTFVWRINVEVTQVWVPTYRFTHNMFRMARYYRHG